jgi:hypothetical protein
MKITQKFLDKINPRIHTKYSQNLYRWLKEFENKNLDIKVFKTKENDLLIGEMIDKNWLHGTLITQVLCIGKTTQRYASNQQNITEIKNFWTQYLKIGRCAIDTEHTTAFNGEEHRWETKETRRYCVWCNNHTQTLKTKVVRTVTKVWTPDKIT